MLEDSRIVAKDGGPEFNFDYAIGHSAKQGDVFLEISQLVQSALDGCKVSIFAYGQTGSRKTQTMIGGTDDNSLGMIHRSVRSVFENAEKMGEDNCLLNFKVSILEIYNESCYDLFGKDARALDVEMNPNTKGVEVPDLSLESAGNT